MLQALIPFLMILAAVVLGTDRRIVRGLRDRQAQSPGSAASLPTGRFVWRWRLQRLLDHGAVVRVAATDRLYLDEARWQAYRALRRRRILLAIAVVVPLFFLISWLASSGGWFTTDL
ncbi:MAG TPA: hypothetical protein VFT29_17055 [Gemmatimonadaceae bacterium]|nr:hypothetical protein [Gemmatimonadaceae bacterium]